ncbi:M48 family metallopeptidase [Commensalibacter oyaizuii]|uniref:Uncharacterized protein n=1 Tax=Commensalibacter oyaizuii TaxID=3043873 RepID=A0ABT6Q363_9PROT|nr:hypothetical protein [Commensalibacter sp. TBRC 16381]MDI2091542.1 hypothetical protein [Commensalibacter sp. TBRC 16381]
MPPEQPEPLTQKNKGLLALVIFLGVLIIIATTVLIFIIVGRIMHGKSTYASSEVAESTVVTRPVSVLSQPQGTRIVQIVRQSDQTMIFSLSGGGIPDRIVIWDVANQQKLSEIKLSDSEENKH